MGCCGKKRASMRLASNVRSARAITPRPLTAKARQPDVPLRYLGSRAIRVRGSASGRVYTAPANPTPALFVDPRDVAALVRTGYFSR
jgi:hypothetical protein